MLSNIKYINHKYILNLPLIKRQFNSIYISYKKVNSSFGNFFDGMHFENTIFGISEFGAKKLFYRLDLEKFLEEEFLIKDFEIFEINIFNKKYSILVLFLENGEIKILSKLENSDLKIFLENGVLKIKNLELDSIIFERKLKNLISPSLSLEERNNKDFSKQNYTSILDIYFFRNFFIKSGNILEFDEQIKDFIFENKNFENEFFPKNKLEIFEKGVLKRNKNFKESIMYIFNFIFFPKKIATNYYEKLKLLKIFLQFKNNYDFVLDSIYYDDLRDYFKEFNFKSASQQRALALGKVDFGNINLEKIYKDLENINKQIQDFSLNYYELEKNYDKINKLNNENFNKGLKNSLDNLSNQKVFEQNLRLKIFKKDLEKIKKQYLEYFREFLEKITNLKKGYPKRGI